MHLTRSFTLSCLALIVIVALSGRAFSSTVAVGTCTTHIHFATIQLAVDSVPGGSTIQICPGIYQEQVTISNKDLTLKGISSGNQAAAIITSPSGGLVQNATGIYGDPIEAQVYVQGAMVTISDLTMDAANSNLDSLGCAGDPTGIYYQNSSGTITRNSVVNDVLSPALNGCQGGLGILVESTGTNNVSITFNNVENYQKNGITVDGFGAPGLSAAITSNTVVGQGPTTGAAENSIQVAYGATGSITSNTVGSDVWSPDVFGDTGDAAAGILVFASPSVSVKSNNVSNTQYGIAIVSASGEAADGAQVVSNLVSTTHLYDGIDLCSNNNTATGNTINGSDESAIHVDDTCTGASAGNIVQRNTINSACAGVLSGPTSGNTISPNTYYNVINEVTTAFNICTVPPRGANKRGVAKSHGRFSPAKP
jgi:Periplasmic copper-binding protein (NosD)